jgi:hypothetical protein
MDNLELDIQKCEKLEIKHKKKIIKHFHKHLHDVITQINNNNFNKMQIDNICQCIDDYYIKNNYDSRVSTYSPISSESSTSRESTDSPNSPDFPTSFAAHISRNSPDFLTSHASRDSPNYPDSPNSPDFLTSFASHTSHTSHTSHASHASHDSSDKHDTSNESDTHKKSDNVKIDDIKIDDEELYNDDIYYKMFMKGRCNLSDCLIKYNYDISINIDNYIKYQSLY